MNFEFKATCDDLDKLERLLLTKNPVFIGTDHQVDTYFSVNQGRLKLREGNIENALIFYQRQDHQSAKLSDVTLYPYHAESGLKEMLTKALGTKIVVNKKRKIYFIDNVKFHFDHVSGLGNFVEVEAIDKDESIGVENLKAQCLFYAGLFNIQEQDYIGTSYSDLLLAKKYANA